MTEIPMGERPPFFTFNIGHIIQIVAMMAAVAGGYYGITSKLENVGYRVERIETAITQLTALSIVTARQDEKLLNLERRLTILEQRK